jgi:acyl-CoA thioesterase FadM
MPVTTEVRVRYAETDQMGIVYYANYLVASSCCGLSALLTANWRSTTIASCRWSKPVAAIALLPATTIRF